MCKDTVDIITLGCSKNLVDSEHLISQLEARGYRVTHDSERPRGDIAVINTCGFIADAQEESITTILEFAERKRKGQLAKLYVMGCLSERFLKDLQTEIPEVDKYYGKFNWTELLHDLGHAYDETLRHERRLTTPSHYAYLKISEGCNRTCSYCAIPLITGHHKSRPIEDIIAEVRHLAALGVVELQVVAQELTYYGLDLYKKRMLPELVRQMTAVEGIRWIRLHYAYPTDFPEELLEVMATTPKVCRYLDVALQHVADPVLTAMRRNITSDETYRFVERLREAVPGLHLRTTLMVGHPGEGEKEFQELLEFTRWARFERMGAFAYSEEAGTWGAQHLKDETPEEVKQQRLSQLMRLQQRISADVQAAKVGSGMPVIIDRIEGDYYIGRTEFDSPEVDPEVLIQAEGNPLDVGHMYLCHIDEAEEFDLYAHVKEKIM